jgi:hypothetical protein
MDESFTRVLMTYYSVTLSAEIAGIYCIYYVLVSYFKNFSRFDFNFEVIPDEEVEEESEEEAEEGEQDLDFDLEYFGFN